MTETEKLRRVILRTLEALGEYEKRMADIKSAGEFYSGTQEHGAAVRATLDLSVQLVRWRKAGTDSRNAI